MRARLVAKPEDWAWSSARAHLTGQPDGLTAIAALGALVGNWESFLGHRLEDAGLEAIRRGERTGRPLGDAGFVQRLEASTGRRLAHQKRGPKARPAADAQLEI